MKNTLLYTHFFPPADGAASVRIYYFAKALKKGGFNLKVIAPKPQNVKIPSDTNKSDFSIKYIPTIFTSSKSKYLRLISYAVYFVLSFFRAILSGKLDMVFTSSPPITTALGAALVAKLRKKKLIVDIRDIWPDIGAELKIIKNSFLLRIFSLMEKFIYNSADLILVTADGDKKNLINKGVNQNKINIIRNGVDLNIFIPLDNERKKTIREKYNLPVNKKVVIYFGSLNLGMNDIDTLADFFSNLQDSDFHFLVVGNGAKKKELERKINPSISKTFLKSLPPQQIAELVASSDVSIIPRKKITKDTGGNIPVKCFESWACGIPVLLSTIKGTELEKIFNESNGGILVEPGDWKKLREGFNKILNTKFDKSEMRNFVSAKFDRIKQSMKVTELIEKL